MTGSNTETKTVGILVDTSTESTTATQASINDVEESLIRQRYRTVKLEVSSQNFTLGSFASADLIFFQCYRDIYKGGSIQGFLDFHQTPYIGSKIMASALAANRFSFKQLLKLHGIPTADFFGITPHKSWKEEVIKRAKRLKYPLIVQPINKYVKQNPVVITDKKTLVQSLEQTFEVSKLQLVERAIDGHLLVGGVLQTESNIELLPIVEIDNGNVLQEPRIVSKLYRKVQELAIQCHEIIGAHGFSRCEIYLDIFGKLWVKDIDILPEFSKTSDFVIASQGLMLSYDDLIEHVLLSATRETISVEFMGRL